ncbi:hypothetical protein [Maribellus mangrovi]|uniref:hypothetical protein n=1 Tax=Maribellus mangrovi TaxID=3133146 RepID=UPI0030EEA12A
MNRKSLIGIILIGISFFVFYGCTDRSKHETEKAGTTENVISEELHKAHCDLLAKANEELAIINQKVRDLNDKIQEGGKLSEAQNTALDDFEAKQASINKRMHEIKNVSQEDWESFKTTFEEDLAEIKTVIDGVLNGF